MVSFAWTPDEDARLREAVSLCGTNVWVEVAKLVPGRTNRACATRWRRLELKPALGRGPWRQHEDELLLEVMRTCRQRSTFWSDVAQRIPGRTARQCRDRWRMHLSPDVSRARWTPEEDALLRMKHKEFGNQWALLSRWLKGRSSNAVKNRAHTLKCVVTSSPSSPHITHDTVDFPLLDLELEGVDDLGLDLDFI